ncbi:MAG: hypothetical protein EOP84_37020 [Verrucomicrobiaceae bacterium]|nr:MAG: hypothetical protein EOP84_37020 [Verrucomicrobiaceae bacterium]
MKPQPPKVITFKDIQKYEEECERRDEEIAESQRLIDCLVGSGADELTSSRIYMPHASEVQLNGWFTPEQLRKLADYMDTFE